MSAKLASMLVSVPGVPYWKVMPPGTGWGGWAGRSTTLRISSRTLRSASRLWLAASGMGSTSKGRPHR